MKDLCFIGTRIRIVNEAAQGIAYLHSCAKPLLHLDVKRYCTKYSIQSCIKVITCNCPATNKPTTLYSSNILLDGCLWAKVCDFSLAKPLPQLPPNKSYMNVESFRGSHVYAADEYLDGQLGPKVDIFSLGVVSNC